MHSEASTAFVYIRHVWKLIKLVVLFYIWGILRLCHSSYFEAKAFKTYIFLWCSTHFSDTYSRMWQLLLSPLTRLYICPTSSHLRTKLLDHRRQGVDVGCVIYRFPTDICLCWHYHLCSMCLRIILKQKPPCHEKLQSFIPKLHSTKHLFSALPSIPIHNLVLRYPVLKSKE